MTWTINNDTTLRDLTTSLQQDAGFDEAPAVAALAMLVGYIQATCAERGWPFDRAIARDMLSNGSTVGAVLDDMEQRNKLEP